MSIEWQRTIEALRPGVWGLRPPFRWGLLLVCTFWLGWLSSSGCVTSQSHLDGRLMAEAMHVIDAHYVQRSALKTQNLTYGAIRGMVDALGDTGHTMFLTPSMAKAFNEVGTGRFTGIGVEIQLKKGHVVVVAPIDGSPAQKAGLRPGDVILKVGGHDIQDWPLSRVVEEVTGRPGTSVALTIQDPTTEQTREVKIVRASIKLHDVTWQQIPGTKVIHLRIARFDQGIGKELREALKLILQQDVEGIILDVRNNPGGLFSEAVTVASQFLSGGNALEIKDAKGRITPVPVEPGGMAQNTPVVVLINQGSASAAEIVAGALQDRKRAALVGENTFGTGTVLAPYRLSDGSILLVAIEEWLTPAGKSFWHKGVAPDVTVSLPQGQEPLLPEQERGLNRAQFQASADAQLARALDTLRPVKPGNY